MQFTLTQTGGDQSGALDVTITLTGSAIEAPTAGADYAAVTKPVHFNAGAPTAIVIITPLNGSIHELHSFPTRRSSDLATSPYNLGATPSAIVTILDKPTI